VTLDPLGSRPVGRRAQARAEQKRKQKRNLRVGGGFAGVLVLVLVLVLIAHAGGGKKDGDAHKRTQQTLLLQVQAPDGSALISALMAHDPKTTEGSVVLVPPQVIASVPGLGSQAFGKALATTGAKGSREALADLMEVVVDGSWLLDRATFQRLVDQEGGITIDVDVTVMSGRVVVLQPGSQKVNGANALAYATYLAAGEQEQTRLARLQTVLDGIVSALPSDPKALIGSLGAGSKPSVPTSTVAGILSGLKKDDAKQQLQYRSLPVIKVDTGTDETRFRIDAPATKSLVDELLADSIPPGARAEGNRVLVLNGVGTPGLGEKVRAKLVPAGFVFVGSRNAPMFGYATTQVLVKDATTAGTELGNRVARALGVPSSAVKSSNQIGTIADVVVIVGSDFRAN
jgi:anionic cell wall polymer biosynthesis LytR-Cps2A-Psr (LCP) family protein